MESARVAQSGDLDAVAALAALAVDELRPTRGGELWALRDARVLDRTALEQDLADDATEVVVGVIDEVVVGFAIVSVDTLSDGSCLARLTELFVQPEAREVGVGEAMIERVLDWARGRGCRGIESLALPGNRATKNFFETFGLTARAIVVYRDLGSDG